MYLQFLNYTSYFFSILFLLFLIKTLNRDTLKNLWNIAKISILEKKMKLLGQKKFSYEKGKTTIYAKTKAGADYKFKEFKRKRTLAQRKNLKAV